jgi:TP53 regulating kinase-like protein
LEDLVEIHRGAEAIIYMGSYLGIRAIYKYRPSKQYRPEILDKRIRRLRTINEARIMTRLRLLGAPIPAILDVDPDSALIVMEYIPGKLLRDTLISGGSLDLCRRAGEILGIIHSGGVYHGDPTISNYIVDDNGDLWIIDFGLADYTNDPEDLAVDLHLLYRSIETLPLKSIDKMEEEVYKGYESIVGSERGREILERVRSIRLRGRYVAERRAKAVWLTDQEG